MSSPLIILNNIKILSTSRIIYISVIRNIICFINIFIYVVMEKKIHDVYSKVNSKTLSIYISRPQSRIAGSKRIFKFTNNRKYYLISESNRN